MSDLAATNCGCGCENGSGISPLWLILLLSCCGNGCGLSGLSNGFGGDNSCCWIIILLLFCGSCGSNGSSCGNGCGC